jgi:hypothetical protein
MKRLLMKWSDLRIWLAQNPNQRVADLRACFLKRIHEKDKT